MLLYSDPHLRCFGENREMIFRVLRNPWEAQKLRQQTTDTAPSACRALALSGGLSGLRQILAHPAVHLTGERRGPLKPVTPAFHPSAAAGNTLGP